MQAPIPANEMERILNLSAFDVDYSNLQNNFKDLTKLAAMVAGTNISLVNLIDSFTQWSVSSFGLDLEQMPREDSVCQYTILQDDQFEVNDLSADDRFKEKDYVNNPLNLRYYFGIPLKTNEGQNIGALCVLDPSIKNITPEKIELLKIIAQEIINRLYTIKAIQDLKNKLKDVTDNTKKVAHDIRGPLSGIIGISQIISEQGDSNKLDQVLEMINLIHRSSRSLLDLADEILTIEQGKTIKAPKEGEFNLHLFKEKIEKLYTPQTVNKKINFQVNISTENEHINFSKNKLLQIIGNLISNSIKFTPENGFVTADLQLSIDDKSPVLKIKVSDSGVGLSAEMIKNILEGNQHTNKGTSGEMGYGFGLAMVKHLIDGLKGKMNITSTPGDGAQFEVVIPMH